MQACIAKILHLVIVLVLVLVIEAKNRSSTSRSPSTITEEALLSFLSRPITVCADEQDGHRSASPSRVADQRRLRRFPREQRQGLYHLRRSDRRQRDHDVHARRFERTPAHPRFDGTPDDGARRESG